MAALGSSNFFTLLSVSGQKCRSFSPHPIPFPSMASSLSVSTPIHGGGNRGPAGWGLPRLRSMSTQSNQFDYFAVANISWNGGKVWSPSCPPCIHSLHIHLCAMGGRIWHVRRRKWNERRQNGEGTEPGREGRPVIGRLAVPTGPRGADTLRKCARHRRLSIQCPQPSWS